MRRRLVIALIAAAGCDIPPNLPTSSSEIDRGSIVLSDDDQYLSVTGCLNAVIGCADFHGETMSVTFDGRGYDVPFTAAPADPKDIWSGNEFRRQLPAPQDPGVDVTFVGDTVHVDLPPAFTITAPPADVPGSATTVVVAYDVIPMATVVGSVQWTCGNDSATYQTFDDPPTGQMTIDLASSLYPGIACTYDVTVSQALEVPDVYPSGSVARAKHLQFSQLP